MEPTSQKRLFYNLIFVTVLVAVLLLSALGNSTLSTVALEQEARCGFVEHVHSGDCYYGEILRCKQKAHSHTQNCYLLRLEYNDINWLLHTMETSSDKSLESVIDSEMICALTIQTGASPHSIRTVRLTAANIRLFNQALAASGEQSRLVFNEDLNNHSLLYEPPHPQEEERETEPPSTDPPVTEPLPTDPPVTEPPPTDPPVTGPPPTEPPVTEPPPTDPPATEPPPTDPPVTEPPPTDPPVTEPPPTDPPATEPPPTEPPVTEPPPTEPPVTEPPSTDPPATEPPPTEPPFEEENTSWPVQSEIVLRTETLPQQGQVGIYLYLDESWTCIDVLNMDKQVAQKETMYSVSADEINDILMARLFFDDNSCNNGHLFYSEQSPNQGIDGITAGTGTDIAFAEDSSPRHFYLAQKTVSDDGIEHYEPLRFYTLARVYRTWNSAGNEVVHEVLFGTDPDELLTGDCFWMDDTGKLVTDLAPMTGATTIYGIHKENAVMLNVGQAPSSETRAINFYFELDGQTTLVNSDTLTYNNSSSDQSRKEYCTYQLAYDAYTNGTDVVTGLTTANIGSTYYFRYNTSGPTSTFRSTATHRNSRVYFSNSNNPQYTVLSKRIGTTYTPVEFYTVTLDMSGVGAANMVQYVESGMDSTLELSEQYLWYTDAAMTNLASADDLENITGKTTLYALYKNRTVHFESNGGTAVADQTVTYNTVAQKPADPVLVGKAFDGWFTNAQLTTRFDFTTKITQNITLYAKWLPVYTVTFVDIGGVQLQSPQQIAEGRTVLLPEGCTWTSDTGRVYYGGQEVIIVADTEFTGVVNTYSVIFMNGNDIHAQLLDIPHGTSVLAPNAPHRDGYRFAGWYSDKQCLQKFNFADSIRSNTVLYAGWEFDLTLTYLDPTGKPVDQKTTAHRDGEAILLPSHYTWTDPLTGAVFDGGTQITPNGNLTLNGVPEVYKVRFVDDQGSVLHELDVQYGKGFLFPAAVEGYIWEGSDGSHYIDGDYFESVTGDMEFTAYQTSLKISYNVNFPSTAVNQVDTVPTLHGTTSATATDTVPGGKTVNARSLTSNTARREISTSNGESYTYYFSGWLIQGTDIVIAPDAALTWRTLSQYADSSGKVNLEGQWIDGTGFSSVSFFVRFDSVAEDTAGNITSRPVEDYTYEIFNTYMGGITTSDRTELKKLEIADTTSDNSYTADQTIRALYGERANGIWLHEFPNDDGVFDYLKEYLAKNPTKRLTVDGEVVKTEELDKTHYAIRWYVMKLESTWHIDGKLVRREGRINIYKDFEGETAGIEMAKDGFYILAENGTKDANGEFVPYDSGNTNFKQHILTLDQTTANSLQSKYPKAVFDVVETNTGQNSFEWHLRNITLDEFWRVSEFPNDHIPGYSFYAEYSVYDSDGELTAIAEYGSQAHVVGKTFALDEDPDQGMTVHFTNYYYHNNQILLKKEDGATGAGIGGAGFNFIQKDKVLSFSGSSDSGYTQDPNSVNTDVITGDTGYVVIDGFSYRYGADSNTGDRGRILICETIVPEGYGWAGTVELGLDANDNVYIVDITTVDGTHVDPGLWSQYAELPRDDVLIIKNHVTDLISVTANKVWNTNVPQDSVEVVLQANGQNAANIFPGLKNAQVRLSTENGWTFTWEDLPRYAGGKEVSWGIKEVVVGGAPTLADGTSFANWIPIYSSGIASDTDLDGVTDNWSFTVTNYSKTPKLILTKVGAVGEALPGAVFTLEQVQLKDGVWQKVAGTTTMSQTTDSGGMLTFENLVGTYTYRLTEVRAPNGYIILIDPVIFTVDGDGNITQLDGQGEKIPFSGDFLLHNSPYNLTVRNLVAVELPETGGMGKEVYWWLGAILMLCPLLLYKLPHRKEDSDSS